MREATFFMQKVHEDASREARAWKKAGRKGREEVEGGKTYILDG